LINWAISQESWICHTPACDPPLPGAGDNAGGGDAGGDAGGCDAGGCDGDNGAGGDRFMPAGSSCQWLEVVPVSSRGRREELLTALGIWRMCD